MGDGMFTNIRAGRKNCHLHTVAWITGYITLYTSFVFRKIPPNQGIITPPRCFIEKLHTELCFGFGSFSDHEQA